MAKITVIGSISTDFVVETAKLPAMGETVEGKSFQTSFGGKGANQAVACARLGAETVMLGAVGQDVFGQQLLTNLTANGIHTDNVERVTQSSGSAFITLFDSDNAIVYVAGANGMYGPDSVDKVMDQSAVFQTSDLVLIQNETPADTVRHVIDRCSQLNIPLLLNPAPARELAPAYLDKVTFLTPNETEFTVLFPDETMDSVLKRYPNKLIITLGSKGAMYHDGESIQIVPPVQIDQVVDTTGAGDTFNGAFAYAFSSGLPIRDSIRFGNIAAGLSIQKAGAQTGAPTLRQMKEHESFEKEWNFK